MMRLFNIVLAIGLFFNVIALILFLYSSEADWTMYAILIGCVIFGAHVAEMVILRKRGE